eukprot:1803860-Amphidinium_carterae.1
MDESDALSKQQLPGTHTWSSKLVDLHCASKKELHKARRLLAGQHYHIASHAYGDMDRQITRTSSTPSELLAKMAFHNVCTALCQSRSCSPCCKTRTDPICAVRTDTALPE